MNFRHTEVVGIGIFAVWPLAKKFGKRNLTAIGFIFYAVGSAICWLAPTNMVIVLIGQFIKNIGGLPCSYVFMALFADVLDHAKHELLVAQDIAHGVLERAVSQLVDAEHHQRRLFADHVER